MEFMYDSENVIVCQLTSPHNFLKFKFLNFATESGWKNLKKAGKKNLFSV